MSVRIDRNAKVAELLGQTVSLGEFNVIVVDSADGSAGEARVVKTLRVDPTLPLASGGELSRWLFALPELQPWLR